MFDYFGFDPKSLSDDDLAAKATELQGKIVYASRFSSAGLMETMQNVLSMITFEQHERMIRRIQVDMNQRFPSVIESDPELAGRQKEEASPERGRIKPQPRPRVAITRTTRPTEPGQPGES